MSILKFGFYSCPHDKLDHWIYSPSMTWYSTQTIRKWIISHKDKNKNMKATSVTGHNLKRRYQQCCSSANENAIVTTLQNWSVFVIRWLPKIPMKLFGCNRGIWQWRFDLVSLKMNTILWYWVSCAMCCSDKMQMRKLSYLLTTQSAFQGISILPVFWLSPTKLPDFTVYIPAKFSCILRH